MKVRALTKKDDLAGWLTQHWGENLVVVHGEAFTAADLDGLVAERDGLIGGMLTYVIRDKTMDIVSLDASRRREGIGSSLVKRALQVAKRRGLERVVVTTTNDNLTALGFWQALGFRLCSLRPGAVEVSRRLKPGIPQTGERGLPISDELDLEFLLKPSA